MGQSDDSDVPALVDRQGREPLTWGKMVARTVVGVAGVLGGLAIFLDEEQFSRPDVLEFVQTYFETARQDPSQARQNLVTEDFLKHWAYEPQYSDYWLSVESIDTVMVRPSDLEDNWFEISYDVRYKDGQQEIIARTWHMDCDNTFRAYVRFFDCESEDLRIDDVSQRMDGVALAD